jgi:hypothetical protein
VTKGWQEATAAGDVRRGVWAPENRALARPEHAFRSGFQAALRGLSVQEWVIDRLVGHRGSTRDLHYVDDASVMDRLREAVERLPPVAWTRPADEDQSGADA